MGDPFNIPASSTFDLTKYLTEEEPKPQVKSEQISTNERKLRAGVKKIDLKAQKYIVENGNEDSSDTEEEELHFKIQNTPVLEACDLYSLLEQFEATELPDFPSDFMEENVNLKANGEQTIKKENIDKTMIVKQDSILDIVKVEKLETDIKVDVEGIKSESDIFINKEIKMEPVVAEETKGE